MQYTKQIQLWVIISLLFLAGNTLAQTQKKRCSNSTKTTSSTNSGAMIATPETYKKVELPTDYKPPVAKKEAYTFKETYRKKQLKQRQKNNRNRKKQGCLAAKF